MKVATDNRRSFFTAVKADGRRLQQITTVLSKHGLSAAINFLGLGTKPEVASESYEDLKKGASEFPIRVRHALEDLGPTFIKLGQILSTRPDILPPNFIQEFEKLQDDAPPIPFDDVREICREAFGRPINEVFSGFSETPLATASMAQVHRAVLDGVEVVVKVQRPGIEEQIVSDLAILQYIARFAEATIEEAWLMSPVGIVQEFERSITQELNFLLEAKNTIKARKMSENDPHIIVPKIINNYTTSTVITQTFIDGKKLNTLEVGSARAKRLSTYAMEAAFRQIFEYGFFHGDPHPGNILITDDDKVAFLDWGLVGHLSSSQQALLVDLIVSFVLDDIDSTARILLRMGKPERRVNLRVFRNDVAHIRDTYLRSDLSDADLSKILNESMEIAHAHSILVNPEYALLTKSLSTVDGILRAVYPSLDILETLRPFGTRLLEERYSKDALMQAGIAGLFNANHMLKELPLQFDQLMTDVEEGRFQVRMINPGMDLHQSTMTILGSRILLGLVGSALILSATVLFLFWNPIVHGVWVLPWVCLLFLLLSIAMLSLAFGWHFFIGGIRRVKMLPWLRLFFGRRKED